MSETATQRRPRTPQETQEAAPAPEPRKARRPCVGLPVQFTHGGELVPAVLARQSRTDEGSWDIKYSPQGAGVLVTRGAVPFSEQPRPGHWNFLPE